MPHNRASMEAAPIPGRRLPVSPKVPLAAGGPLGLLASSMTVAILLVMGLTHSIAMPVSRLAAILRRAGIPSRGPA